MWFTKQNYLPLKLYSEEGLFYPDLKAEAISHIKGEEHLKFLDSEKLQDMKSVSRISSTLLCVDKVLP